MNRLRARSRELAEEAGAPAHRRPPGSAQSATAPLPASAHAAPIGPQGRRLPAWARRHPALLAMFVLIVLSVIVSWRALRDGGLFFDDWWIRSLALYNHGPERQGFFGYARGIYSISQYRPLDVPYFMVHVAVTNFEPFRYQLWGCLVTALAGFALYAALRVVRLPWAFATAAGVVYVALPYAASSRFWSSLSLANASNAVFLVGLALGGIALRSWPDRRRWPLIVASLVLIGATAAFYEMVLPVLAVTPLYYAVAFGRWGRPVVAKVVADGVAAAGVLAIFRTAGRTDTAPLDAWWPHARTMAGEGFTLFRQGLLADGQWRAVHFVLLGFIVVALVVALLVDRRRVREALIGARAQLSVMVGVAGVAFAVGLLGYLFLVPDLWYRPLMPGQGDRTNSVAVIGFAASYVAIAAVIATIAGVAAPRRWVKQASAVTFIALVSVTTAAFVAQAHHRADLYIAQWQRSAELYRAIDETLDRPLPPDTLVLSFGSTLYVSPLIHSIGDWADFDAAVKLATDTGTIKAAAIFAPQRVICGDDGVELPAQYGGGPVFGPQWTTPYGRTVFMQPYERRTERIDSRLGCEGALARFTPGALF